MYPTKSSLFNFQYAKPSVYPYSNIEDVIYNHYKRYLVGIDDATDPDDVEEWHDYFQARIQEIMPMYSKLYDTLEMELDPLTTKDITIEGSGTRDAENTSDTTNNGTDTLTRTDNLSEGMVSTTTVDSETGTQGSSSAIKENSGAGSEYANGNSNTAEKFSDTPQGRTENLDDLNYLTTYKKDGTATNSSKVSSSSESNSEESEASSTTIVDSEDVTSYTKLNTGTQTDTDVKSTADHRADVIDEETTHTEHITGYEGIPVADLLQKYREGIINYNEMILHDIADLFILVF